jgi:hypothetical protein
MAQITSISNGEALSSVRTKLNDVITNVNLLDPTDWVDYSATSTIVGWSSFTEKIIFYRIIGKQVFINFLLTGTSNSTSVSFTLPVNLQTGVGGINSFGFAVNNGINSGSGSIQNSGVGAVIIYSNNIAGTWTSSGTKSIRGQFFYIID